MKYCVDNYISIDLPILIACMMEIYDNNKNNIIFLDYKDSQFIYPKIKYIRNKNDVDTLLENSLLLEKWIGCQSKLSYLRQYVKYIHITDTYKTHVKYLGNYKESIFHDIYVPLEENYIYFYIMNDNLVFEWNLNHNFNIAKRLNLIFKKDIFINSR